MFPLDERVFSRGTGFCSDFMSGMDFFPRSRLVGGVVPVGVRYAEGARESVWRGCCRYGWTIINTVHCPGSPYEGAYRGWVYSGNNRITLVALTNRVMIDA